MGAAFCAAIVAPAKKYSVPMDESESGIRCRDESAASGAPERYGKDFIMNKFLIATGALILAATTPASAQLLGGGGGLDGGLAGGLGGGLGGSVGGGLGGGLGGTMGGIGSTTESTVSGAPARLGAAMWIAAAALYPSIVR